MTQVRKSFGRNALLAAVFAVTAATAITGATYSGVSKESSKDEACASATWPAIPSYCLIGAPERAVRTVSVDRSIAETMNDRFAVAFN